MFINAASITGKDTKGPDPYRMVVMQPGEKVVCVINRHPIGIVQQYIGVLIAIIVASVLVLFTIPGKTSAGIQTIFYLGLFMLVIILIAILGIATRIYWENRWVITTDSLTQIIQGGLFGTRASALSLEELEDITIVQQGILMHMFNYGTLEVETNGEHSKLRFIFCPEPVEYARKIINAKEEYLASKK